MLRSWSLHLVVNKSSPVAIYLQIAQQMIEKIQSGQLPPAVSLPSTRELAQQLKVNRKTVVLAFDELIAQGWLSSESRRGTFVAPNLPIVSALIPVEKAAISPVFANLSMPAVIKEARDPVIDFNDGIPDSRLIPFKLLSRAFRHALLLSAKANKLGYDSPKGMQALRHAVMLMLNIERGLNIELDNVCIVRGSQMGIFLAARILTQPNDFVVFEKLSYPPARAAFKSCGAQILNVGQDWAGIDVDALEAICKTKPIRAVYVTPHHQFPTTVMMSAERRLKLIMLAKQYGFWIIEDDYDHEFHFYHHPVLPLASMDHGGHVIYIGSFSKVLAPGLRLGYMVAAPSFIQQCAEEIMLIDRQGNSLTELALAELLDSGEIKRHIRKTLKTYNERRNLLMQLLNNELGEFVSFDPPSGGLAIWLRIIVNIDINQLVASALREQVRILPWTLFAESQLDVHAIRLGFGNLNNEELALGVQKLKRVFLSLA